MYKRVEVLKSENNFSTGIPDVIARYECDTESDLPTAAQSDCTLQIGTTAHVIETNSEYKMQSSGVWVLQNSAGYYTRAEIDALFASIPQNVFGNNPAEEFQLSSGDDLNEIIKAGNYTAGSTTIAQNVANSPWTATRYKFVNLVITGTLSTNLRAVQFIFPNIYTSMANYPDVIFFIRYRHNATFTPWKKVESTTI